MKSQPSSSFPLKLTSPFGEKNVCIRIFELATLMPDWPPSPKMVTDHFLPFVVACVPLSWVPPWIVLRALGARGQALELERREAVVQRRDRLRDLRQPVLAVGQVAPARDGTSLVAADAVGRGVDERAVEPPDAAVVPDEDDVGAERHAGDRVLVRVQADALRVDRHVGEVRRRRPASAGSRGRSSGTGSGRRRRSRRTASRRRCRPRPGTRAASTRACRTSTARRSS